MKQIALDIKKCLKIKNRAFVLNNIQYRLLKTFQNAFVQMRVKTTKN